ncbi:serine/threonine-protein kinase [Actinomycetospora chlora]|uniref:serine/threonine-protein kinase n=1 Tax=Actinomycetospora chlora TaxID=663608 RepID=UPI0031E7D549
MVDEGELIADRYRVRARVGQGAMGVVWRAEDERLQREVALKQVALPAGADEAAREQAHRRVFREGRMIARLHHPHAITVYDVVEHAGQPWLVMEYLPSSSLAETIVGGGPLEPHRVGQLGRQVADALAAAHAAGIVHRDVKPGNVLLGDAGVDKVTDFGIARAVDDVTITSTGMMAGTPAYLAPEVARGEAADFRSDVYSLGSTLYAALEGRPPFGTGENPLAVLHRVASGEYAPLAHRGAVTSLVERLLRPDPAARPDMAQVRDELSRLVAAEAGTEEGPVTPFFVRPDPATEEVSTPPTGTPGGPPPPARATPVASSAPAMVPVATAPRPGSSPAAPPAAPAPGPASGPPGPPPTAPETRPSTTGPLAAPGEDDPGTTGRGRRWPWVVAVAAVVVVVAAFALAAVLSSAGGGPTASVPGGTAAPATSGESTPEPDAGTSGDSGASPLAGDADDQARQQAIIDYYGLIPVRLDEGWQRLTPSFQQQTAGGFDSYRSFWGQMQQVTVRGVSPAGGDEVDATVTYRYQNGREVDERTVFRLVQQDGIWKIDGQRQS